jgi:uncharacterized protein YrrD
MKSNELSTAQLLTWKAQMSSGVSPGLFQDPATGKRYIAISVIEQAAGFFADLREGKVFEAKNDPIVGIRTIKGQQIEKGINLLVYGVRTLVDTTLVAKTEDALKAAAFSSVAPGYFKNGEVRISQGAELLQSTGDNVSNSKAATSNDEDYQDVAPFQLRESVNFQTVFSLAGTPGANDAYKLQFKAIRFVETDQA